MYSGGGAVRRWLSSLLFPNRCYLCGKVLPWHESLCVPCCDKVPYILPPTCLRCGRSKSDCSCHGRTHSFERSASPLYYTDSSKLPLYNLKVHGYRQTVDALVAEMAEVIRREYGGIPFDAVVPVPLYVSDYVARGFNQAELLARALAEHLRVPYRSILKKIYATKPQKTLTLDRRRGNLLGAFDVVADADIDGAVMLLVDDVNTTGSTLDECAKMLRLYGAKEVYVVTAAAAPLEKERYV